MTGSNSDRRFVPEGWHSVTPRIAARQPLSGGNYEEVSSYLYRHGIGT